MPTGITPARGPWEYRRSLVTTIAQGQFQKGDLVALGVARVASLYTGSNMSSFFGVAMNDSLNSLPVGYCTIAIPLPGCTAYVDTLTTDIRSNLSWGEAGSIVSAGGRTSTFSKLATSVWSRVVEIVSENPSSADSRVEVSFLANVGVMYSASSQSLLV
jgi:hypothetical protein